MIGLGTVGLGITKILRNRGYIVYACDACPGATINFVKEDGVACVAPVEVAAGVGVVVSVMVNTAQTEAALFGEVGVAGIARRGSTFVICSMMDPNWSIALEARPAQQDILHADGPISGGAAKAASGQIVTMTPATPETYAVANDVLDAMANEVYRLGDEAGAGNKVEIINRLLVDMHTAAAIEVMALGLREGMAADVLYETITHSTGNSWMLENRMAYMLVGDYMPLSVIDIFVKDLGLVLDTARASKLPLPLAATTYQMFMQTSTAGCVREDDSVVIKIFPGITLPEGQPE